MKYYQILDVPLGATQEQIKDAYRILVQLHHPDRLQQVSANVRHYAEERLKKINEAYQVLGDPERRQRYDRSLAGSARSQPAPEYADYGAGYAGAYDAPGETQGGSRRRSRRRPPTAEEAAAQAAYEEWAHKEAERYAEAREAERARQERRENRAAEARARRAAEEQFPRASRSGDLVTVHFAPGVWTRLARVPAGEFLMGSSPAQDPDAAANEQPQHRLTLSEFFIGQSPVTNAQFQAFARSAQYALPGPLPADKDNHPVVNVAWDDAMAFCGWLSRATHRVFRLPTEAEWEKAARGEDGALYPWGDTWDPARANGRRGPSGPTGETTPVSRFAPDGSSPYGLLETSGNVWEWCSDWFDPKTYARRQRHPLPDPPGPPTGLGYVARGGAFDSLPKQLRCAYRNWFYPDDRRANLGFRIVVVPF